MGKIHTILKKHFKTPLSLLVLYTTVGFLVVAGAVVMYGDGSSCGGAHHHTVGGKQTVCPVTGVKIDKNAFIKYYESPEDALIGGLNGKSDKNVFVEYKGEKVYFCCPSCKGKFEKNPEKYISKLPQFRS